MVKTSNKPVNWDDVKLVIFDCDGVLSDGKMIYSGEEIDIKNFNAHDGMGFTLLHKAGLISAVITGRSSKALEQRCKDLDIKNLYQDINKKVKAAEKLLEKYRITWKQAVYLGDDWNDVPVMQKCALSACPFDAMPEIKHMADLVTERSSGEGAAREFIDYVLYQKGIYDSVVKEYLEEVSS